MPRLNSLPQMSMQVQMSDGIYDLCNGTRLWNLYSRTALAAELLKHHRERIPKHFRLGARSKYDYERRKLQTERKKIDYWKKPPNLDLVRSGRSQQSITSRGTVTFSGSFGVLNSGGTLQGRLKMNLPYPFKRNDKTKAGGITPEEIEREITAITEDEARDLRDGYRDRLVDLINSYHGPMRTKRPKGNWRALLGIKTL